MAKSSIIVNVKVPLWLRAYIKVLSVGVTLTDKAGVRLNIDENRLCDFVIKNLSLTVNGEKIGAYSQ